jgi:hypothetical protein
MFVPKCNTTGYGLESTPEKEQASSQQVVSQWKMKV